LTVAVTDGAGLMITAVGPLAVVDMLSVTVQVAVFVPEVA
jgi:uncharacterized membrane protein YcjF (UPF0283 family)